MNRKKPRRRSTSAAIYISVAALLIIVLALLGTSVFLKIMHIEVDGAARYTEEEIIIASGISSGNNLLFIDTSAVSDRIYAEMPYISDIKIIRVLPNLIHIDIRESAALASIRFHDSILLIDSAGRVLQIVESVPSGLIEVIGFTPEKPEIGKVMKTEIGDETRFKYLTDVLAAIESTEIRGDVAYVDITSIANITLGYTERFRVILGSAGEVTQKLRSLPGSIDRINETRSVEETGIIDMSDTAAKWRFTPD